MLATNRDLRSPLLQSLYPWMIVFCGMLFYCYNYFLRSSTTFMQNELSQAFHITASQWGMLTSAYYWGYTPMQIPAGMIYDKFGVRFVLSCAILVSAIGIAVFSSADTFTVAWVGRFIIGLGCAFAYIGTLKLAAVWLPANRFAIVAGLTTAAGMSCGAFTQKYVSHAIGNVNCMEILHPAIFIGMILSIFIFVLVKDNNKNKLRNANEMQAPMTIKQLGNALYIIFSNPQMWLIGIIGCLLYLPASGLQDSVLKEYLTTVYNITPFQAANVSILLSAGWIISGPIIGAFSDRIRRRCLPLTVTGFFAAVLLCITFFAPHLLTLWSLYTIFFFTGFCCGAHPLCFPLGKENNPIQISGTAIAVTNMLIMTGGAICQPIVGKLLDYHTTSPIGPNGLPVYSASDYTFALSVIPIGVAVGIFLSIFLKETYCVSQAKAADEKVFNNNRALDDEAEPATNQA
jgi:MFS family permease